MRDIEDTCALSADSMATRLPTFGNSQLFASENQRWIDQVCRDEAAAAATRHGAKFSEPGPFG